MVYTCGYGSIHGAAELLDKDSRLNLVNCDVRFKKIYAGNRFMLGQTTEDSMYFWGSLSSTTDSQARPTKLSLPPSKKKVFCGWDTAFILCAT
jgi:hypothetical protein